MARPTREQETRRKEWKEPNELDVPDNLKDRLKSEGYETRWIRILMSDGKPDAVNVMTRLREGYEFVKVDESPEWEAPPSIEYGKHGNLIVIGDLALAKLPTEVSDSRKRQMREKTANLTDAINRQLYENRQLNERMPISNNSKSQTYKGTRVPASD